MENEMQAGKQNALTALRQRESLTERRKQRLLQRKARKKAREERNAALRSMQHRGEKGYQY